MFLEKIRKSKLAKPCGKKLQTPTRLKKMDFCDLASKLACGEVAFALQNCLRVLEVACANKWDFGDDGIPLLDLRFDDILCLPHPAMKQNRMVDAVATSLKRGPIGT